ncbi:ABC transporter permease [Paenibacillus yanchengensis]|uniref:ABC transporter permease n=1 Tax=Paenibacillus yanchengensis TaxID=2035833 RepID=A0ABW4YFF8_9BACL
MGLFLKYMAIHLKAQLEYRTSLLLLLIGQLFVPLSVFAGVYFMFERFGSLQGWTFLEVALCYAIMHMAYSLGEFIFRGFDTFSSLVVSGNFDRLLVRPRHSLIQVLGSKIDYSRIGRLLQGVIIFIVVLYQLPIAFSLEKVLVLIFMIVGGIVIFGSIFILQATLCFWTVQSLEVANIFTDGSRELVQYPLHIYEKWVRIFYTFVIPFGAVGYYPLLFLLDKQSVSLLAALSLPWTALLFLMVSLLFWRFGVRYYRSTGS